MKPVLYTIGEYNISSLLVFSVLFVFVYIYGIWYSSKKDLKVEAIFDIGFLTLIFGVVFARLIGIGMNYDTYLERGFSLFPISEVFGRTEYFYALPWSFITFGDGNLSYIGLFLGLVVGLLFIYLNSNKQKSILQLVDRVVLIYAGSSLLLLIGIFLSGTNLGGESTNIISIQYSDGVSRYPLQLLQIFIAVITIVVFFLFRTKLKKYGLFSSIFLIVFGVSELILRLLSDGYSSNIFNTFDFYQVVSVLITVVGIFLLTNITGFNILNIKSKKTAESLTVKEKIRIRRERLKSNTNSPSRFAVSFADRGESIDGDLSKKENISRKINTIKRRLSK